MDLWHVVSERYAKLLGFSPAEVSQTVLFLKGPFSQSGKPRPSSCAVVDAAKARKPTIKAAIAEVTKYAKRARRREKCSLLLYMHHTGVPAACCGVTSLAIKPTDGQALPDVREEVIAQDGGRSRQDAFAVHFSRHIAAIEQVQSPLGLILVSTRGADWLCRRRRKLVAGREMSSWPSFGHVSLASTHGQVLVVLYGRALQVSSFVAPCSLINYNAIAMRSILDWAYTSSAYRCNVPKPLHHADDSLPVPTADPPILPKYIND